MIRESRGSMGKRLWKLSQTHLTLLSSRDTTGAWVRQNAIINLKNGLFGVKFDGESAELWCSKAQGHGLFQNRCDFGSFRDLFLGAVYIYIYIYTFRDLHKLTLTSSSSSYIYIYITFDILPSWHYTAPQFWSRNDPKSHLVWKKLSPWALRFHNSADSPSNLTSNRPFFKFLMAFSRTHVPVLSRDERRVRWVWESFHSLLPMLPLLSLIILVPAYHWARVYDE